MPVTEHLAELVRGLGAGWKQLAERLQEAGPAAKVSVEVQDDGRVKLNVRWQRSRNDWLRCQTPRLDDSGHRCPVSAKLVHWIELTCVDWIE